VQEAPYKGLVWRSCSHPILLAHRLSGLLPIVQRFLLGLIKAHDLANVVDVDRDALAPRRRYTRCSLGGSTDAGGLREHNNWNLTPITPCKPSEKGVWMIETNSRNENLTPVGPLANLPARRKQLESGPN